MEPRGAHGDMWNNLNVTKGQSDNETKERVVVEN